MSGSLSLRGRECTPGCRSPGAVKKASDLGADQGEVEVAGARPIGVEGRPVAAALAGHRASAQHRRGARGEGPLGDRRAEPWSRWASPPKTRRTSRSRISSSVRPARVVSSAASCSAIRRLQSLNHCSPANSGVAASRPESGGSWPRPLHVRMGSGPRFGALAVIHDIGVLPMLIASFAGAGLAGALCRGRGPGRSQPGGPRDKPPCSPPGPAPTAACRRSTRSRSSTSSRRSRPPWPSSCAEIDAIADDPAPPTFENTIAALERAGRTLDRVDDVYGVWSSTMSTPEFQEVESEMAPKLAAFATRSPRTRRSSRASRRSTTRATSRASRPSSSGSSGSTTPTSCAPAPGSTPPPRSASSEINQALATLYTSSARTCWPTRASYVALPRQARPTSPACPSRCAPAPPPRPRAAARRASGPSSTPAPSMEPFLTYSDRPRPAREGLAHVLQPRRQRRRARQQRAHHRDPGCAPSAPSCSATRPTPTGGSRTRWPRRPSAPWS